ncbi:MAG: hypothetical protein JWO52_4067 [Gammaproteobacteria bacterium]|nr:hypothetical protein [Gammaproteobacteria bacterium]
MAKRQPLWIIPVLCTLAMANWKPQWIVSWGVWIKLHAGCLWQ